jgi:tripartite-type tricarboxylate transporter receptor subunit TctC
MRVRDICIKVATLALLICAAAGVAYGQSGSYPDRPVTVISDSAAGSAPDVSLRFFTEGLSKLWGQQVVVMNHPGANGSIAARAAAEGSPDGYTLFATALSTFVALPTVAPNLPVKVPRDFLAVGFFANQPMFLAVNPGLGIATLPQLIERAKADPGKISIALTGIGRVTHLTGVLLEDQAHISLLPVPYSRGPAAAMADVASGRVSMIVEGYAGIIGAVKAGEVKLIAVATAKRLPEFPDLPTVAETLPGFTAAGWSALLAPVGTPASIISQVNSDLNKVASDPAIQAKLAVTGNYTQPMTPEETQAFITKQQETWQPILQKISIR